ncbi:MAG: putative flavoprotein involved in transport, partial [Frankiales bacterium]|nr:putative flavoprotein involved in transport [Frankiales bacterium]
AAASGAVAAHVTAPLDVLVVGAGQAGLGTARALVRAGIRSLLVVDAVPVGTSWLDRWESLQLFTPRHFSALPRRRFPSGPTRSPSRTEMAAYLQEYARDLPVRTGVRVERLQRGEDGFLATTPEGVLHAHQVVLATGPYSRPRVPGAARGLGPGVVQLHSSQYRRPSDVPPGGVVVVGGGNSAAQLALELARDHGVHVAASRPPWFLPTYVLGVSLYWWLAATGLLGAPAGSAVERYVRGRGDGVVGRQLRDLVARGEVGLTTSRVVGADSDALRLQDGTRLPARTVLWCTGSTPDTAFVDVPGALDDDGGPRHDRGASPVPGLHWVGLPWQSRMDSGIIHGVGADARRTARRVQAGLQSG